MTADPAPRRRRLLPVALVVLVVVIGAAVAVASGAVGGGSSAASPEASVPGVVPADAGVVAEGRAVPVRAVELQAAVPGTVASLPVREGETVAAGEPLLALDTTAADADVATAQAGVQAAEAGVDQAEASRAQAVAGRDVAQAAAEEAAAARRAAMAARDAIPSGAPSATKRQANAQVDQASAALDRARAARVQASRAVDAADAAVAAAKADVARATASLAAAKTARDQLTITAPFAGTLVSVVPVVGDRVQPGVPLVRLADLSGWRFETSDLSETSVARVAVGAPATISVDGLPGSEIAGTVASVGGFGDTVQGDITYRAVVTPTGTVPDGLRWNMTVTMDIEGEPAGG